MKFADFLNRLTKMNGRVGSTIQKVLYKNEATILQKLKEHSPKDSGYFASQWRARRLRFTSTKTLAGLVITNKTPGYGQFAAAGAEPGQAPWYFPHRVRKGKKKGQMRKGTGKLKLDGGKVWAGGLSPGHDKTVGGVIQKAVSGALLNKLTIELSDESVKAIL